jgi:hypothetical protein
VNRYKEALIIVFDRVQQVVTEWEADGVVFRVEDVVVLNELDEVLFEKKPRLILDNVPLFMYVDDADVALLREHEDEVVEYLRERES